MQGFFNAVVDCFIETLNSDFKKRIKGQKNNYFFVCSNLGCRCYQQSTSDIIISRATVAG